MIAFLWASSDVLTMSIFITMEVWMLNNWIKKIKLVVRFVQKRGRTTVKL